MAMVQMPVAGLGAKARSGSAKIVVMATNRSPDRGVDASRDRSAQASFKELALPELGSLYNHACWLAQDATEAEDLVQEALAKALKAFDTFEAGTNFKAWIFRILRNTFLSSRTAIANARTVFLEDEAGALDAADPGPSAETELIRLDDRALVQRALGELAPHLREVILLCDVEELKYREIAAILNVPIGTVMSRLARARQALREYLTSDAGGRR
jgi:RNA polymerase sigma factor (sigma-70 family)